MSKCADAYLIDKNIDLYIRTSAHLPVRTPIICTFTRSYINKIH